MIELKVQHVLHKSVHLYAPGVIRPVETYRGEIVDEDNEYIHFKYERHSINGFVGRISKHRVLSINNVEYVHNVLKDVSIKVKGSKGNTYDVARRDGIVSCTCPGYKYRGGKCKHLKELAA